MSICEFNQIWIWLDIWIFLGYPCKLTGHRVESICYTSTIGARKLVLDKMREKQTTDSKFFQIFTTTHNGFGQSKFSFPFTITLHVKLVSLVEKMVYSLLDSFWKHQIWASSVNRKLTYVEFLVGEKNFSAHRSVIFARSPVFAILFNSGSEKNQTNQVQIEDVEPDAFGHFLHFIYTGTLESSAKKEELYPLAVRY